MRVVQFDDRFAIFYLTVDIEINLEKKLPTIC
jgi:hypothetical protein